MTAPARLLDANVLIALVAPQHAHHAAAHRWFAGVDAWATTPLTEAAFVRLVANPAVTGAPHTPAEALDLLRRLRSIPGHTFVQDDVSLVDTSVDLGALVGYRQVTDFHLLALAAANGLVLATFDARLRAAVAPDDQGSIELIPV
ncbi:TA system VapC family ribonuclease toxin [Agromyces mangrovi Wang et al. 2018]|uniref:TA system VapC family ribonuclease toxin n=1 Tax=Agromyces mangrovi TaxID=1858653 RepID=UPI002573F8E8|nr:TA system VapC family ribonuclease toxin [Agromyces mangrovi]BDZ65490.1 ribonuclease VapC38 [Agromyces mangrovi]